ncbi:MAG: hypothetical protein IT382_22485 [Deltaproteobacteria bacterium]|nr:hypothetical protein [Deltaproteobacteria bacterium]
MRTPTLALTVALALLGQLSSLAHLWVVEHQVCAEHGQLVDEDGEHCAVSLLPAAPVQTPALLPAVAPVAAALTTPLELRQLILSRAVLDVAPKTSPPA